MSRADSLAGALRQALGDGCSDVIVALGEVTIVVRGARPARRSRERCATMRRWHSSN